jgi:hypothetical protein
MLGFGSALISVLARGHQWRRVHQWLLPTQWGHDRRDELPPVIERHQLRQQKSRPILESIKSQIKTAKS